MSFAQGLSTALGTNLYDLQILPYHPDPINITLERNKTVEFHMNGNDSTFNLIKRTDTNKTPVGVITWATKSSGSFNIIRTISINNRKMDSQTRFFRISSPNWSGQFDFTPEMVSNSDRITYFNVDYTYLPYSPYIHIAPVFEKNSMYGNDYDDARGLICGGDFSISYTSDKWIEYTINNKNLDQIFKRGIENLQRTHKYDIASGGLQSILGAIGTGIGAGFLAGTGVGIGAGAVSLVGGAADLGLAEAKYKETLNYREDIHELQLDNIKALPNSLTKVGAFNENNKVFPVLEEYDCTDTEKLIVANKIKYEGMTVNAIGKIRDYINNSWSYKDISDSGFIKGKFIQINNISDDTHLLNAIAEEFNKGVYTK